MASLERRVLHDKKNEISLASKIPKIKDQAMNRLIENPTIQRLVRYDTANALREKVLDSDVARSELLYSRIFPYRFVPQAIEEQGTFITIGSYFTPMASGFGYAQNFNNLTLYFYVFTHVDLMRTKSGVRQDLLMTEIDKIFDKTNLEGMGLIRMRGVEELWLHNNKFGGYVMAYTIGDM